MNIVIKLFNKLLELTSIKEKEALLEEYKDNLIVRELLFYNLNPYMQYGIKKMPDYTTSNFQGVRGVEALTEFKIVLKNLNSRELTGNSALSEVSTMFSKLDTETAKLFESILLKKAIGVGAKTVNKAFKESFIPQFDVMLAPNKLADIVNMSYPCQIQPKLDGYRCLYIPGTKQFLWSRAGKPFSNNKLSEYFDCLRNVGDYVLDGELYLHGIKFQNLTSILNTEELDIPKGLKFVVFDCIPLQDWLDQSCDIVYDSRLRTLRTVVNSTIADYSKVIDVASDVADNSKEVKDIYKNYLKKGYEGIMIKNNDGLYQWKRVTLNNGAMLKLKPFNSIDLKVKEIYEGEGNFEGMAGGIICNYNGNSVRVGTGFDMATRKKLNKNPKKYIGKTAELKYFEETEKSLRFPVFVRWRSDK